MASRNVKITPVAKRTASQIKEMLNVGNSKNGDKEQEDDDYDDEEASHQAEA